MAFSEMKIGRGITHTYFNPESGWGEGQGALKALVEAAISRGVHFKQATVSALSLDENNDCYGVELEGGERLEAKHIIVATGAWTPWFLAETAPLNKDVQLGNSIVTAGCNPVPSHIRCFRDGEAESCSRRLQCAASHRR